jgi:hypothetical protein
MLTTAILIDCLRLVGKGEGSLWHIFLAAVVSQLCVYGGIFLLGSYLGSLRRPNRRSSSIFSRVRNEAT